MTSKQLAEAASTIRTGFGTRRDFTDTRTATPEHECPVCENILREGEICTCQDEDGEPESVWYYLDLLTPAERKQEEAYQRACARGFRD